MQDSIGTERSLLDRCFRESPHPAQRTAEAVEVSVETNLSKHGRPRLIGNLDRVRSGE